MAVSLTLRQRFVRKMPRLIKAGRQWARAAVTGGRPGARLVFVVGSQRSGTRVPVQILDCSPRIATYSEGAAPFFATALLEKTGDTERLNLIDKIKLGSSDGLDPKMQALLHIARTVQRAPRELTAADVDAALSAGASDADVQLAVLIAAAFSMYNRMVEGFRAQTPPTAEAYRARASEIADFGYSAPAVTSVPR